MARSSRQEGNAYHVPVLCKAVLEGLITDRAGIYVDATVGGGGHADAILNILNEEGCLVGIDQDPDAIKRCRERFTDEPRFQVLEGNFRDLHALVAAIGIETIDGVLLDLGVSSHQIDTPGRGFSYREDGPLNMRMDRASSHTAAEFLNGGSEAEIARVLWDYGEEFRSRRIAEAIVNARPISGTRDLADVISSAVPARDQVKTLSRTFQAIRIAVNEELNVLEQVLPVVVDLLKPGGRVCVISYHSLEDRRAKRFLRFGNFKGEPVKDLYGNVIAPLKLITKKPIRPDEDEAAQNRRSRSARMRIAERVSDDQSSRPAAGF